MCTIPPYFDLKIAAPGPPFTIIVRELPLLVVVFVCDGESELSDPKRNVLGFYSFKNPESFSETKHARDFLTNVVCIPHDRQTAAKVALQKVAQQEREAVHA